VNKDENEIVYKHEAQLLLW